MPDPAAVVVTEAMLGLARYGYDPKITDQNGLELYRLGTAMLSQFGIESPVPGPKTGQVADGSGSTT